MQVVVLAGGLATRMKPLSEQLPKVLFPVAGRPFLDHQLALLVRAGASQVLLCVGHLGHQAAEHLAASPPPVVVKLSEDGKSPAGTGGALIQALTRGQLEPRFVVMYGDSYLPIDLRPLLAAHELSGLPATMATFRNREKWDASNCIVEGQRVIRYEKIKDRTRRPPGMLWIDYGATVLERSLVESWPHALPLDLAEPLARLSTEGRLGAFTVSERFYEIGSSAGLDELEAYLTTGR